MLKPSYCFLAGVIITGIQTQKCRLSYILLPSISVRVLTVLSCGHTLPYCRVGATLGSAKCVTATANHTPAYICQRARQTRNSAPSAVAGFRVASWLSEGAKKVGLASLRKSYSPQQAFFSGTSGLHSSSFPNLQYLL